MIKNFLNLTNGLEKLTEFNIRDVEFIRICSTTLERKDGLKLLGDLDHNFLFHLAIGTECHVWDYGTNRPCSKSIYQGVEIIRYVLNRYWHGLNPSIVHQVGRNGWINSRSNIAPYFSSIYDYLFTYDSNPAKEKMRVKLKYYKRFLVGDRINLTGRSESTSHDGDYKYYSNLCLDSIALPI